MKDKKKVGIGLKYALNGIKEAVKRERNFRIHLFAALVVIIISFFIGLNKLEWLFIVLSIHIVWITELINSVIERVIDYVKPEYHQEAKIIKDISAGIVLISAISSVVIGTVIFLPKLLKFI